MHRVMPSVDIKIHIFRVLAFELRCSIISRAGSNPKIFTSVLFFPFNDGRAVRENKHAGVVLVRVYVLKSTSSGIYSRHYTFCGKQIHSFMFFCFFPCLFFIFLFP